MTSKSQVSNIKPSILFRACARKKWPWATAVFDFGSNQKGGWPQLVRITKDGKRLFITMNQAGKVVMFDTSEPAAPRVLRVLDLGAGSGPHFVRLTAALA